MSRSYRKQPISTDGSPHHTKEMKRHANSKVRNTKEIFNGSSYKKLFCSYDIHDFISRYSKAEAIKDWYIEETEILNGTLPYNYKYTDHYKYKTLNNYLNKTWAKWFKRK